MTQPQHSKVSVIDLTGSPQPTQPWIDLNKRNTTGCPIVIEQYEIMGRLLDDKGERIERMPPDPRVYNPRTDREYLMV